LASTLDNPENSAPARRRTPLYETHVALGARMVEFAGYDMPVSYDGILAEHARVRTQVGLFDVSHMGEVHVVGKDALAAVNALITNDLGRVADGRAQYTALCNEDGTIVDDLICYRLSPEEIFICVNASNRAAAHGRERRLRSDRRPGPQRPRALDSRLRQGGEARPLPYEDRALRRRRLSLRDHGLHRRAGRRDLPSQ
jgi:glycine cleavage system aminomethyltransferase T